MLGVMFLMMVMAVVMVGCWLWWDKNKDSTADGKGSRPVFYVYQSLLSTYESRKLTSYYSSVEPHFAGLPQFRVWKTCLSTKQQLVLDGRRTGQREKGEYIDENFTSSEWVLSATYPQYDAFMNQSMSPNVTTQACWHTEVPVLVQPKCLLESKPVINFSSHWDLEIYLNKYC